jgi:hypothetical protein
MVATSRGPNPSTASRWPLVFGRADIAAILYAASSALSAVTIGRFEGRGWVLGIFALVPIIATLRARPVLAGLAMIVGSIALRFAFGGAAHTDTLDIAQSAAARAFQGLNPYGVGYASSLPPGIPYPYGPVGLIWWLPGEPLEFLGAVGTLAVLLWARAWITLAVVASLLPSVLYTLLGINDYSVGFVLISALVLLRFRPILGILALALAISIKPYAAAWALPAMGYAGLVPSALFLGTSLLLWSPVLFWWGPDKFVQSMLAVEAMKARAPSIAGSQAINAGAINLPIVRWLAVPLEMASLPVSRALRSWRIMALSGCAVFVVFLFFSPWTHWGYWIAVGPVLGLALEGRGVLSNSGGG